MNNDWLLEKGQKGDDLWPYLDWPVNQRKYLCWCVYLLTWWWVFWKIPVSHRPAKKPLNEKPCNLQHIRQKLCLESCSRAALCYISSHCLSITWYQFYYHWVTTTLHKKSDLGQVCNLSPVVNSTVLTLYYKCSCRNLLFVWETAP